MRHAVTFFIIVSLLVPDAVLSAQQPQAQLTTDPARDSITAMFLVPGTTGSWLTIDSVGLPEPAPRKASRESKAARTIRIAILIVIVVGGVLAVSTMRVLS